MKTNTKLVKIIAYGIISTVLIFVIGIIVISSMLGRPSYCIVNSVDAKVVSYAESDTLGLVRISDCKKMKFGNRKFAIIVKPNVTFEPSKTGTYQPGILGIKDTISAIVPYLIYNGSRNIIELQPIDDIDRFRVYDCNGNLSTYGDRDVIYFNRDTTFFENSKIPDIPSYVDHLNSGKLFQDQYNIFGVHDSLSKHLQATADYSIDFVISLKE